MPFSCFTFSSISLYIALCFCLASPFFQHTTELQNLSDTTPPRCPDSARAPPRSVQSLATCKMQPASSGKQNAGSSCNINVNSNASSSPMCGLITPTDTPAVSLLVLGEHRPVTCMFLGRLLQRHAHVDAIESSRFAAAWCTPHRLFFAQCVSRSSLPVPLHRLILLCFSAVTSTLFLTLFLGQRDVLLSAAKLFSKPF